MSVMFSVDAFNLFARFLDHCPNRYVFELSYDVPPNVDGIENALFGLIADDRLYEDVYTDLSVGEVYKVAEQIAKMWR